MISTKLRFVVEKISEKSMILHLLKSSAAAVAFLCLFVSLSLFVQMQ